MELGCWLMLNNLGSSLREFGFYFFSSHFELRRFSSALY